jgi:hypothetical protein
MEAANFDDFLCPYTKYRGNFSPEFLAFNSNLQEFAHKVSYICALQTNGKLSPIEAYTKLDNLWQQLAQSKQGLEIGNNT